MFPNITATQLFNVRSSLYNAQSDVLFNESISMSLSECWSYSTADIRHSWCSTSAQVQMSVVWNAFCTVDSLQLRDNCQVGKHGEWPKCTVTGGMIRVHWTAFRFIFIWWKSCETRPLMMLLVQTMCLLRSVCSDRRVWKHSMPGFNVPCHFLNF